MKARLYKIFSVLAVFFFCLTSFTAGAANLKGGEVLYLKPNSNWKQASARFAAYFCNGTSSATWVSMTKVSDDLYVVTAPTGDYKNVIFCRMNPGNQTNSWGNKWTQTGDLTFDGTLACYKINNNASTEGTSSGTWSHVAVAGNGTSGNPWCGEKDWDTSTSKLNKNGTITFSKVPAGEYKCKVVACNEVWLGYDYLDTDSKKICTNDGGNIKIKTTDCSDITIKLNSSKISVSISYYDTPEEYKILGVGEGDAAWNWENGLAMVDNPENVGTEMMYSCLKIDKQEEVKIYYKTACDEGWVNAVSDGSVVNKPTGSDNIILPKGVYAFYYKIVDKNVWIGHAEIKEAYLVGLGEDKKMTYNSSRSQYELKDVAVKSTDKVKVKLVYDCGNIEYVTLDDASCSTVESTNEGLTFQKDGYYDFYFKSDKTIYVGANESNPANADKYYLMGVDGDWDKADESNQLTQNPNDADELVLLGQKISQSDSKADAIKIVKKSICAVDEYYAEVKPSSTVIYTGGGTGVNPPNIVIEDGTYDFYFNKTNGKIYITGSIKNARVVYLDPKVENGSDWESDGARMAIYYFKSSNTNDNGWIGASYCDGYYYAYLPEGYDKYDWCRMNPDGENNWENRWNQTNSITYSEAEPLTKLKEMEKNSDQIPYNGSCGISYDNLDCNFPPLNPGDTLYVHINQFEDSDPCNYKFSSFEQAFAVLKNNDQVCTSSTCLYGSLKEDEITLTVPVVMLVHCGPEPYRGTEKVGMSGGHIYDAPAIFFRNINKNGVVTDGEGKTVLGHTLIVRTADPKGNRAVIVHPVIRRSTNIVLDNLDVVSDPTLRDNAIDIDTGMGMGNLEGLGEDYNIVPLSTLTHNITLKNCMFESYGRNCIHVVGIKGIHVENNEFYTKYDFSVNIAEGEDVVEWGGTIKFINTTDVKFLRNDSEGTLATSFFIQGCQRVLLMNNVFWNDNAVAVPNVASEGRSVANVRLVNFGAQADEFPIKNIGIYYNTFFIKNNDLGAGSYHKFDFFRLGGKEQLVTAANFEPSTIRFQYNNCYSYDKDITGNNDDETNAKTFYLQSIGKSEDWCQCFKYNNFWSEYDKKQEEIDINHVSSNFEMGKFCTGVKETYNAYVNAKEQVCQTDPARPSALVVKGGSLNIGTVVIDDVSGQGADTIFADRLNGDAEKPIRPTIVVDNSNESLSPSDHIYKEPGTIHFYTTPIVDSQTTDVHVSSVALTKNSKVYLSIVDGDVSYFAITDGAGKPFPSDNNGMYLTTDAAGSLDNQPIYVTFKRPTKQVDNATFSAFLQILPASNDALRMLIPLKGHNIVEIQPITGAWTVGAFQQREVQPVDTIIWRGTSSTNWDDRNNWYKKDGTSLTCLDALTENLTVIIPNKDSKRYKTPPQGITNYPILPVMSSEHAFGTARTEAHHGEQVNAGPNDSKGTTKVANKIYMEYGASLVGVEELGAMNRYTEVEQEFIARRDDWLLVGTVVKPWVTDELGNIVDTRLIQSGDYYKGHLPHVYMHEAVVKDGNATWDNSFADLNIPVPADRAYAIRIPDQYGPIKLPADFYNMDENTNYDPTEPITFTFKGRFYNEDKIPTYEKLTPEKTEILSNTYPANINAYKLWKDKDEEVGTFQVYDYTRGFQMVGEDSKDALIQSQHGFVFTPAEGVTTLEVGKQYMTNSEVTHRSAEVEIPYVRVEMQNVYNHASNNVYIQFDAEKVDAPNGVVDAPKLFTGENIYLPDLYVMRYGESYSGLSVPTFDEPIPLGVIIGAENQTYIISIVSDNMPSDVMLDDRKTGKIYNLSQGEVCVVDDLPVDTCENRFYLQFVDRMPEDDDVVTSVTDTEADAKDITIYTEQDDIVVSSTPNVELQRIVVVDMAGKHQVYNVSGRYAALSLPLNRGIYTVHVIGDNAVKTEKVHIY